MNEELIERAKRIKLLLMDCDGVLTDGKLFYGTDGESLKVFNVRDGQGIVSWQQAGFVTGIISGRNSKMLEDRGRELGIRFIRQGVGDKLSVCESILVETGLAKDEVAFVGDDLPDIPLLQSVGFAAAVADAAEEVLLNVHFITKRRGGNGAVRELCDLLLELKNQ